MFQKIIAGAALAAAPVTALEAAQPPAPPAAAQAPARPPSAPPAPIGAPAPVDPARMAAAERFLAALWPDALFIEGITAAVEQGMPLWTAPTRSDPARDPHHAERERLTREATLTEYTRLVRSFAPELRTLAARFYARNMSVAELEEATRFYAGPAGRRLSTGSFRMAQHAEALSGMQPPQPDPELIAVFARLEQRIKSETAHLAPPPPPPPPPPSRAERRRAERERAAERRSERSARNRAGSADLEADIQMAPPAPPAPPPPPPAPADPARLAAARRAAAAIWSAEAFAQPLPLPVLLETVLALPVSSFGPAIPLPQGVPSNGSIGQALTGYDRNAVEGARIVSRILAEELPGLLPRGAPLLHEGIAEIYAREFTVAELESFTRFYEAPAGRALARQTLTSMLDPEFVRGMILAAPRMIPEAWGAMIRIGQATAHLPPPPPEFAPAPAENGAESRADRDED